MTEEKMRELCKEIVPEIEKIMETLRKHSVERSVCLSMSNLSGQVTLIGKQKDFDGWELVRFDSGPYEIWHHDERMLLDEE